MSRILRGLATVLVATAALIGSRLHSASGLSSAAGIVSSLEEPPSRGAVLRAEHGTYIAQVLRERDSTFNRWPNRVAAPIRVWIQPTSDELTNGVRDAFT